MEQKLIGSSAPDLQKALMESMHQTIFELLPEEQRLELVKTAIENFTKPSRVSDGYGRWTDKPSILESLVHDELREWARPQMRKALESCSLWKFDPVTGQAIETINPESIVGAQVANVVRECLPEGIVGFFTKMAQGAAANIIGQLRNSGAF